LKTQFDAMSNFVSSTTKVMSDNLNKTMGGINATMISQLKTTVDQLKKSFDGLDTTTKKSGDGFKSYTKQINEATKEMQKAYQEQERMQRELEAIRSRGSSTAVGHLTNQRDEMAMVQAIEQQKAKVAELTANVQRLRQEEERYKNTLNQSDIAAKQRAKDMKQAAKDEQNLVKQKAKLLEGEMRSRQKLSEATKAQAEAVKQVAKEQANVVKQLSSSAGNTGYGDYARRVREEAKAEADFRKQQGQANLAAEERAIAGRTAAHKAGWEEIIKQEKIAAQEAENFRKQQGQAILAAEERAIAGRTAQHKAAWQEIVKQEDALDRQKQTEHNRNQQRIKQMQTQYNVAYAEINKYLQAHAKMSEAVFIRLQGKLQAITAEMQRLGAMPVIKNPLANMNYADYEKQFGKFGDMMESLKHHLTWMASATAIGVTFGIPAQTIHTIAEVEKQMAQMKQVNEGVRNEQEVLNKTTQDFIGIAQKYGHSVDEIIKSGVLWGRAYKDLNTVMQLTNLSAKLAVADNMNVDLANRAVESVINGYQKQGQAIQFATHVVDSWTKIAHNAQSSATDLAEALMRTGAAAKAVGVDFDTTNALASTMIKATGRSGAEIGNALKSLFSSIHSDKSIKQLQALGIEMYKVDEQGQKHFRNLHDVFVDLMITSHTTSQNMEKDLLAISGGRRKLAA